MNCKKYLNESQFFRSLVNYEYISFYEKISVVEQCFSVFLILSLAVVIFVASCAGRNTVERSKHIMGYWRTEKNIIMSIHMSPEHGLAAFIKNAPGFLSEETKAGKVIITHIKPLVDGGFTAIFEMPYEQKPVKVKMVLASPETLIILSWDRRAKGNTMKWQRVSKLK